MKLHLHTDGLIQAYGPRLRSDQLKIGLDLLGIDYTSDGTIGDVNVCIGSGAAFSRFNELPQCTPMGPNIIHDPLAHVPIVERFTNFIVQSDWVADLWRYYSPELCEGKKFFSWPFSVDLDFWKRNPDTDPKQEVDALWYTKYQNSQNRHLVEDLLKQQNQTYTTVSYKEYTPEQLRHECCRVKYAIFQSCCEKSPHAMLEILAMGVPVFVVDSQRWIGDDSFDRATSAPYFDTELCGDVNVPDKTMVEAFYKFRQAERLVKYNPRSFAERYTIESSTQILIDIVKECHGI